MLLCFVIFPNGKVFGFGVEFVGNHLFIAHDPCIVTRREYVSITRMDRDFLTVVRNNVQDPFDERTHMGCLATVASHQGFHDF